jgi:N-acyl homoserine lactone hydrolase
MIAPTTILIHCNGKPVKIHAISTGQVRVAKRFRDARFSGIAAQLDFLLCKQFTEWMPVWVWVIEHPEGVFIIDTGEIAAVNDKDYFTSSGRFSKWVNTKRFQFDVSREEEIDRQLKQLNIDVTSATVILTHIHLDHIDGIKHFPQNKIIISRKEWEKPFGHLPKIIPGWLKPQLKDFDMSFQNLPNAVTLTTAKDLLLVYTPGHTFGHSSVLLCADEGFVLFAGDITYNQKQIEQNILSGVLASTKQMRKTYEMVQEFAKNNKLLYLASHDDGVPERMKNMEYLKL